jgi:diguanylate cyclase (GGDEF)-like protein/PAS domain S-box-containing protein
MMTGNNSEGDGSPEEDKRFTEEALLQAARLAGEGARLLVRFSDRRILACDDAAADMFGYPASELRGRTTSFLHVDQDRYEQLGRELHDAFQRGLRSYRCHFELRRRDGESFPAEMTVAGIFEGERQPSCVLGLIRDLSRLSKSAERLPGGLTIDDLVKNLPGGVFQRVLTADGKSYYTFLRGGLLDKLDVDPVAAQRDPEILLNTLYPEDLKLLVEQMQRSARDLSPIQLELRFRGKGDETLWVKSMSQPRRLDDGSIVWDGIVFDVTPQKTAEATVQRLAYHDEITNLPNQAFFWERLRQEIQRARQGGEKLAVIAIDLARFRRINEMLGYQRANELLSAVGQSLLDVMDGNGFLARHHGDEFRALLPVQKRNEDATISARKLLAAFDRPFPVPDGEDVSLKARTGIAVFPDHGASAERLLHNAETALADVRGRGDADFAVYSPEMTESLVDKMGLEAALRRALKKGRIEPWFQPQYDLETGAIVGFEALARWEHDGEWIPPDRFIPVAEETGLIGDLSEAIVRKTLQKAARWRSEGLTVPPITINYSVHQLREPDFRQKLLGQLETFEIPATLITVEVTESVFLSDFQAVARLMEELAQAGVAFSIDDFGTGYSSFSYLSRLPLSILKIDRSFVTDLPTNPRNQRLVQALVQVGRGLELQQVIAEGVETRDQVRLLRSFGCRYAQGFLLGRPAPAEETRRLLAGAGQGTGDQRP